MPDPPRIAHNSALCRRCADSLAKNAATYTCWTRSVCARARAVDARPLLMPASGNFGGRKARARDLAPRSRSAVERVALEREAGVVHIMCFCGFAPRDRAVLSRTSPLYCEPACFPSLHARPLANSSKGTKNSLGMSKTNSLIPWGISVLQYNGHQTANWHLRTDGFA